jgi:hypothetical protein
VPAAVRWLGVRLVDGTIVEDLPIVATTIGARLGAFATASVTLNIPEAPAGWVEACEPNQTMLVLTLDDVVVWGGRVVARDGGTDATATLSLATLESYLDWRYVGSVHGDWSFVAVDEAIIVSGLVEETNYEGIGLLIDAPATGTLRDRTYLSADDKTAYAALQELMAVQGGPEWTVELGWADPDRSVVAKTLVVRDRVGVDASAGAIFQTLGEASASYTLTEDHSTGKAANHVLATSTGDGEETGVRPESAPARDEARLLLEPRYELRFVPSTSITTQSVLDDHAAAKLALVAGGARVLRLTARFDAYPRLGVDWRLGDTIGYELYGHRHPDGLTGADRCVGWDLDLAAGLVTPYLLVPGEDVAS